ncbi:transposable element Tcb2 transposase [Trichonephila clavipes]|nr:transposable element Tcb2 transposase [Trichonephila clavipes]
MTGMWTYPAGSIRGTWNRPECHPQALTTIPRRWNRLRKETASDLSRQLSSATGTTASRQTVYRRLGHIGLYARGSNGCVPLTATHCRLHCGHHNSGRM